MLRQRLLVVWFLYISTLAAFIYCLFTFHPTFKASEDAVVWSSGNRVTSAASDSCSLPRMTQPGSFDDSQAALDVWIVAGQSNAVGDNWRDVTPLPDASPPAGEDVMSFTPQGSWLIARPNIHLGVHNYSQPDSIGPDMSFARTLIAEKLATRVGLVPTAKCNTDLASDWSPSGGNFYTHMLLSTRAAMQAMPEARLIGMIWVQGESDAVAAPPGSDQGSGKAAEYLSNLQKFVSAVRSDLSDLHPCLPIILGVVSPRQQSAKLPNMQIIRQHQLLLDLPAIIKVDMDPHEFYSQGEITLHLSKRGQNTFGTHMALAYKAWIQGQLT